MTFFLLQAVREMLQAEFTRTVLKEPDAWYVPPRVFIGALPPKRKIKGEEQNEDFPFIVVRGRDGKDSDDDSLVTVEIIVGIYCDQDADDQATSGAGDNDIINMVDRCRGLLLRTRIVAGRWELQLPMTWKLGDEDLRQPHPYYLAMISASFKSPETTRQLTISEEADIYGTGWKE